jgi:hypothetical protein
LQEWRELLESIPALQLVAPDEQKSPSQGSRHPQSVQGGEAGMKISITPAAPSSAMSKGA